MKATFQGGVYVDIINQNNEFVVIDIETSHFHPQKGGMIIELAAVKIKNGKIVDKRTQLINPERKITAKITEMTGITNEMLEGKPTFREVLPKFYNFVGDAVIVGHNIKFDWDRFLVYFLKKVGIYPNNPTIDTLTLCKKYIKLEEYKLGTVCDYLNINHLGRHRALGDALATAKLFLYLVDNYIKNDKEQIALTPIQKQQPKVQNVRKVVPWEKKVNGKTFKRLYVTLDRSVVFFDIPTRAWEVKSSNEPIDFKQIEKSVLLYLKFSNIEELINHYANAN